MILVAFVFAQSIEATCYVENGDVVGAAPTGGTPTTSEWSTILSAYWVATYFRGLAVYIGKMIQLWQCGDILLLFHWNIELIMISWKFFNSSPPSAT